MYVNMNQFNNRNSEIDKNTTRMAYNKINYFHSVLKVICYVNHKINFGLEFDNQVHRQICRTDHEQTNKTKN